MSRWTDEELATLLDRYADESTSVIAADLGRSRTAVRQKARQIGLAKSGAYMQRHTRRFKPGRRTWNKGRSFDAGGASVETRFHPGNLPHTWNPIGHERLTKDGILQRKIQDTRCTRLDYVPVHVLVYREHFGPVPDGHIVVFRDGDKRNFDPANLECISRAENMRRNSVHRLPKELALAVQLQGALKRQINKRAAK